MYFKFLYKSILSIRYFRLKFYSFLLLGAKILRYTFIEYSFTGPGPSSPSGFPRSNSAGGPPPPPLFELPIVVVADLGGTGGGGLG